MTGHSKMARFEKSYGSPADRTLLDFCTMDSFWFLPHLRRFLGPSGPHSLWLLHGVQFNVLPKGLAKRHEIIHHPDRVFPCVAHVAHVRCSLTRKEAAMLKILHISGEQLAELGEEELSSGQTCMIL